MNQTSTNELILLFSYRETTPEQTEKALQLITENESVRAQFEELMQAKQQLSAQLKSPSTTSLNIIMEHSHKTAHLQEI